MITPAHPTRLLTTAPLPPTQCKSAQESMFQQILKVTR